MHGGMCQGGAGLLGQDGQQLDLVSRRCTVGTDHQTPVDGASVSQRECPPPPAFCGVDAAIPAGLVVSFKVGVCWLGWWKALESAVDRPVAGLHVAGCEAANGVRGDAKDLVDVGITERDTRQHGQAR